MVRLDGVLVLHGVRVGRQLVESQRRAEAPLRHKLSFRGLHLAQGLVLRMRDERRAADEQTLADTRVLLDLLRGLIRRVARRQA